MNIVYGVSGEGLGHCSRAKEMIPFLIKQGHKILVLTYGEGLEALKEFKPVAIPGINVSYTNGKISLLHTITKNASMLNFWLRYKKFAKEKIVPFSPNAFITDFEPMTSRIANYLKRPLISLGNQHELLYLGRGVPVRHIPYYLLSRLAIKACVTKADYYIIVSFFKKKVKSENVFFVSPIIREKVAKLKPVKKDFVLVYLSKESKKVIEIIKSVNEKFIVYGPEFNKIEGRLAYKKKGESFLKDLQNCKAVISTAGFSLISEALYLKKPFFGVPLKGQFEQELNGLFLKEAQFGDSSNAPKKEQIEEFLRNLKRYEERLKRYSFDKDEAKNVLNRVLRVIKE